MFTGCVVALLALGVATDAVGECGNKASAGKSVCNLRLSAMAGSNGLVLVEVLLAMGSVWDHELTCGPVRSIAVKSLPRVPEVLAILTH